MREFLDLKLLVRDIQSPRGRFGAVAFALLVFICAFLLLFPHFGLSITFLSILPILVGAWFYGIWQGILFTFATWGIDIVLIAILTGRSLQIDVLPGGILGLGVGILASLIIGRQGVLVRKKQEESHRRVNELAGLHDIAQAFSLHDDARQTFGRLTRSLAERTNARICLISLYNPAARQLIPQSIAYGLDLNRFVALDWSSERPETIWDFSRSGTCCANSPREIPAAFAQLAKLIEIESVMAAPLWDAGKVLLGVIFAANKPGGFTQEDAGLLEILSSQVTAVIQNVRLLNAERERADQLALLHAVAQASTQSDNEDELIGQVTDILGQKRFSDNFGVLLLDETGQVLHTHSSYLRASSQDWRSRMEVGVGVAGWVAASGVPLREEKGSTLQHPFGLDPASTSILCVPLKIGSTILGVINMESEQTGAFSAEDEDLLAIIAGQLATAIHRLRVAQAERYQTRQLERSNSLIRALAQVNAHAALAPDPEGVLETLGNELTKLGLRCAIALIDASDQYAVLQYISLPDRLIRSLERLTKLRMQNYAIPIEKLSLAVEPVQKARLVEDHESTVLGWVPDLPQSIVEKLLALIGLTSTTSVCYLTLITEGKPMGVLWMWGEGLHESDLPTMSLFASQLAAVLQNANLLSEVGRLAITDELTGIFNRRHFLDLAEKKFARAKKNKSPISALIIDLDHFKLFNDKYGHVIGDQVLRAAAQKMSAALRDSDIIGRYGGEEFAILLPDTSVSAAAFVAKRLLSKVSDVPIETSAGNLSIQLSIGVAGTNTGTGNLQELIQTADQAMYQAKSEGRNRVAVK